MKTFYALATILLLSGVAFAGSYGDISIDDLEKKIAAKEVTVIDVNGTDSYKKGRVPGAIDFQAEAKNLKDLLPEDKDALIVAYCGSPRCGAYKKAAKMAESLGYTNVKHMSAGIKGWKAAEKPLEMD